MWGYCEKERYVQHSENIMSVKVCVCRQLHINATKNILKDILQIARAYVGYFKDITISQQDILTKSRRFPPAV